MSSNWIRLIGLLLVSHALAADNATDSTDFDHAIPSDQLKSEQRFKCEHGKSLLVAPPDYRPTEGRSDAATVGNSPESSPESSPSRNPEFDPNGYSRSEFSTIVIFASSKIGLNDCTIRFRGPPNQRVEVLLDDALSATNDVNDSFSCGNLKFEEPNHSELRSFCPPSNRAATQPTSEASKPFQSISNNLTLHINSSNRSDKPDEPPVKMLSIRYRFAGKTFPTENPSADLWANSVCDHLISERCYAPARCTLQSVGQQSAGAGLTCKYLISQQNQSTNSPIVISQRYASNEIAPNNLSSPDCSNSIGFYEGSTEEHEKLITRLCLPISRMPMVKSDSGELLVVYTFNRSYDQFVYDQLIVQAENRKARLVRYTGERNRKSVDSDSCNVYYNVSTTSQRSGQIVFRNQLQEQPKDMPCFIHLTSTNPFDRIWFYFLNFRPASLINTNLPATNQFLSTADSCKITEFRLFDSPDNQQLHPSKGKLFCGSNQPKTCNPNRQQCWLPSESYLSTGSRLGLMAMNKINPSLYLLPLQFTMNYEFINTQEYGEPVIGTTCDRLFDSSRFKHGTVRSTRNLFLFGRGGRQSLNCNYIFRGQPGQRLRIQLYRIKVKSADCTQQRDPNSGANKCVYSNARSGGPSSRFSIWDSLSDVNSNRSDGEAGGSPIRIPVDCFCNKTMNFLTPISFHLIGGQATLNFTIENMRSTEDFNDYGFDALFEFLSTTNDLFQHTPPFVQLESPRTVQVKTSPPRNYSLTTHSLTVPSNYSFDYYQEFKQRKRLIGKPNEHVLISVPNGFLWKNSAVRTCSQLSRLVVYWILPSSSATDSNRAIATVCIEPSRDQAGVDASALDISGKSGALNPSQMQLSFELGSQANAGSYPESSNPYSSNHASQLNQLTSGRTLHFYANNSVDRIDLVIELIATSKGQFRFDWLQSLSGPQREDPGATRFHSSMRTSEPNQPAKAPSDKSNGDSKANDNSGSKFGNGSQCVAYCPEDGLCLKPDMLCDQISHCSTTGFDENPTICEAKEQNRLEQFLSAIASEQNKIDKVTLNDGLLKNNWFILFTSSATFVLIVLLIACLVVYLRRRSKHHHHHQSMSSGGFASGHLQIGGCNALHTGTLQTGSASSTFSGNSSLTSSSCTNSMLCEKRLKKLKQKMSGKEPLKAKHLQTANALSLMRSQLEDSGNHFNPLIPSFGNNSTTIHQQINQQQPADYVSTSEFQFELNQDRLNNYNGYDRDCLDRQSDFSPLYKKIDPDEYSLKQQHIYYQPSYTTLQRNNRPDSMLEKQQRFDQQRIDSGLDKPPLPPLPSSLLSAYHPTNGANPAAHHEPFGLRGDQLRGHPSQLSTARLNTNQLSNHHTIARQSLLDSNQAERLLMSTPIYEVADRQQFNNSVQSMHRSALLRAAGRRFS